MKSLFVTAGHNWGWPKLAAKLAERINRLSTFVDNGVGALDISDKVDWGAIPKPQLVNAFVWRHVPEDVDRVIWIDADCFLNIPVSEGDLPTAPFNAVRDTRHRWLTAEFRAVERFSNVRDFFHSGVFVATRESMPVFEFCTEPSTMKAATGMSTPYQDMLNCAVADHLGTWDNPSGWSVLGHEWNAIYTRHNTRRPIIVHFSSVYRRQLHLDRMYAAADVFEGHFLKGTG